jgi:hypothetical protein
MNHHAVPFFWITQLVPEARREPTPLPDANTWKASTPDKSRRPDLDALALGMSLDQAQSSENRAVAAVEAHGARPRPMGRDYRHPDDVVRDLAPWLLPPKQ